MIELKEVINTKRMRAYHFSQTKKKGFYRLRKEGASVLFQRLTLILGELASILAHGIHSVNADFERGSILEWGIGNQAMPGTGDKRVGATESRPLVPGIATPSCLRPLRGPAIGCQSKRARSRKSKMSMAMAPKVNQSTFS